MRAPRLSSLRRRPRRHPPRRASRPGRLARPARPAWAPAQRRLTLGRPTRPRRRPVLMPQLAAATTLAQRRSRARRPARMAALLRGAARRLRRGRRGCLIRAICGLCQRQSRWRQSGLTRARRRSRPRRATSAPHVPASLPVFEVCSACSHHNLSAQSVPHAIVAHARPTWQGYQGPN